MALATIAAARSGEREPSVRYTWTYVITAVVLLKQLPRIGLLPSRSSQACALLALRTGYRHSDISDAGAAVDHR